MVSVALLMSLVLLLHEDDKLLGEYEVIANVTDTDVQLSAPGSTWKFNFEDKGVVSWIHTDPDYTGIPISGARMNVEFDTQASPKRLKMWYQKADEKTDFAYGIYKREKNNLMIKLLLPQGVASNGSAEDVEQFRKSPYPVDFAPPKAQKLEVLFVLKQSQTQAKSSD